MPDVQQLQVSYDFWNRISLWLTFLTALVALLYFISTKITNDKGKQLVEAKDQQISQNLKDLSEQHQKTAEAQREAAEAQLTLKQYVDQVSKRQEPRKLPFETFTKALKDKPAGQAEIMYQPEDPEANMFAWELWQGLAASKWQVKQPVPIPMDAVKADLKDAPPSIRNKLPAIIRAGGQPLGISLVVREIEATLGNNIDTPQKALSYALLECGFGVGAGRDTDQPVDFVRILVGPKP